MQIQQAQSSIHQRLIQKIVELSREERRIGVAILELLQEIERRKAYAELRYDGLFSFCVKELHYSEAQAYRRIQAMRAMVELPELREKIESGALTVTTVSQVQTHLKQQSRDLKTRGATPISKKQKLELFGSIENQSAKQVEQKIQALAGATVETRLHLRMDTEMQKSWDQIKNQSAHSTHGDPEAILKMLMREWLEQHAPKAKKHKSEETSTSAKKDMPRQNPTPTRVGSRYISVAVRRELFERDRGKCQN